MTDRHGSLAAIIWLGLAALVGGGCAAPKTALRADLAPLELGRPAPPTRDLFKRDGAGSISEEDLQRLLAAPVVLERGARVGVVKVAAGYEPDESLPLAGVTGELSHALEASGLFEVATEVATDWPADRGISGLRELAARYRAEYLLLYRHRFVNRSWTNGWGWLYPTVIGILFAPSQTLETAGILEATLFDVRTGTLLYTVYERVSSARSATLWHNALKQRDMQQRLLERAAGKLAEQVVAKVRRLASRAPAPSSQPAVLAKAGAL